MKSLSVKFSVILIGFTIFVYADGWGVEKAVYSSTREGYVFHPKLSNGRALGMAVRTMWSQLPKARNFLRRQNANGFWWTGTTCCFIKKRMKDWRKSSY